MAEIMRPDGNRIASELFAQVFQAYLECSDEVQSAIRDMVEVVNAGDATDEERFAAVSTMTEALFPSTHNGDLGIDLDEHETHYENDSRGILLQLNAEEATFAERLQAMMEVRGMTQGDVADLVGIGQSAVSMMLNRKCRPQRRTVEKIALALKVSTEELWPGIGTV